MKALEELQSKLTSEDNSKPIDSGEKISTDPRNKSKNDEGGVDNTPLSEKVYATKSKRAGDTDASKMSILDNSEIAQNVQIIMKVLEGNIQRSIAKRGQCPGGLPRRYKKMNSDNQLDKRTYDSLDLF